METSRKIIHIDMDAFYASVEQRDNPNLRGRPVIVGGDPAKRGVVAACSYEARKFGIHSAMPSKTAIRLCPMAVFLRPRFDAYKTVSCEIREIFREYSDLVEPLSLDEAFIDVTENKKNIPYATKIAIQIREKIYKKTLLTASAGVSFNKFLAKVASDVNKPNGIMVVTPEDAPEFIDALPIRKFFGVGRATEKKMYELGIRNGADLKKFTKKDLVRFFGKPGNYFFDIAHGLDTRPVKPNRIRKSIGKETTLTYDTSLKSEMLMILEKIAGQVEAIIKKQGFNGLTLTLKIKFGDFTLKTRSITLNKPVRDKDQMMEYVKSLLDNTDAGKKSVRLLGISVSNSIDLVPKPKYTQLPLPFPPMISCS